MRGHAGATLLLLEAIAICRVPVSMAIQAGPLEEVADVHYHHGKLSLHGMELHNGTQHPESQLRQTQQIQAKKRRARRRNASPARSLAAFRGTLARALKMRLRQVPFNNDAFSRKRAELTFGSERDPGTGYNPDRREAESENDDSSWEGPHVLGSLLVFTGLGIFAFLIATYVAPLMSDSVFTISVIVIYVATSVGIDIFISLQKEEDDDGDVSFAFDPICVVITTEVIKLVISILIYIGVMLMGDENKPWIPEEAGLSDVKWLTLPAALFCANNILIYYVIMKNDISTFGIFRDTTILWTAIMWRGWFAVPLGDRRVQGILLIFFGMAMSEVTELVDGEAFTWTFMWVVLLTLVNSLAGVSNEFALKRNASIDLNLQNIILYLLSIGLAFITLALTSPRHLNPTHFYDGFTQFTMATSLLQAFGGLIVSRVLKYADAVTKTVASCLRGPTLILLAPFVLSDYIGVGVVICSFVIAFGCWLYLREGPMTAIPAVGANGESASSDAKPAGEVPGEAVRSGGVNEQLKQENNAK